jgi:TM2 domain-containing membrane protein YozV
VRAEAEPPPQAVAAGNVDAVSTPDARRIRIGTEEREAAVRELGEHLAAGRLEPQEYEERMSAAYTARFATDLDVLFDDLPRPGDAHTVAVHRPAGSPATREAPYGRDPITGLPYSDRYQVVAGVLQLLVPIGLGRFYTGHTRTAVAQLLLSMFVVGMIWAFIDGIVMLAGHPTDAQGRPLRP